MMRGLEVTVFTAIAIAAHVAVFAVRPEGGTEAGGSGGEALLSIQSAAPRVVKMVEAWDRPVDVQNDIDRPVLPKEQVAALPRSSPVSPIVSKRRSPLKVAGLTEQTTDPLRVDMASATPTQLTPPPAPKPRATTAPPKAVKADRPSDGRAGQKAAGSGGAAQAGNSQSAAVTTATKGRQAKLKQIWGAKIRSKIARAKRFPRNNHATGTSVVRLTVRRDGALLGVKLVRSSGDAALDQAAIATVKRAKRFAKAPKELPGATFNFVLPIEKRR